MFRNRLRNKLLTLLLLAVVFPFSLSIAITYNLTKESVKNKTIEENTKLMFQGKNNLLHYLDIISQATLSVYDESVHTAQTGSLFRIFQRGINNHLSRNEIYRALQNMAGTVDEILQIYVYVDTGPFAYLYVNGILKPGTVLGIEEITGKSGSFDLFISPTHISRNYGTALSHPYTPPELVFTLHRPVYDVPSHRILGVVSVDVGIDFIRKISDQLYTPEEEQFYLLDQDGTVIYASEPEWIGQKPEQEWVIKTLQARETSGYFESESPSFQGIYLYDRMSAPYGEWTLVKRIPYDSLYRDARQLTTINSLILLISLVVATLAIIAITLKLTGRIKHLLRAINKVESGNMELEPDIGSDDELGVLSKRFYQMVDRLNQLVLKEYRLELANKTNQLRALQAQINPHFLNNALQSIGTLALQKNQLQVYRLISSLGKMMHYHTNNEEAWVLLSREMEHVKAYLHLQMQRYEQNLSVHIDEDTSAHDCQVPKMILQPIVENYFKHGFDSRQKEASLHITTRLEADSLHIRVEDNGKGMALRQLNQLNTVLKNPSHSLAMENPSGQIGLRNVASRLHLYFGDKARLQLIPRKPRGLIVQLVLPASQGKGEMEREGFDRR